MVGALCPKASNILLLPNSSMTSRAWLLIICLAVSCSPQTNSMPALRSACCNHLADDRPTVSMACSGAQLLPLYKPVQNRRPTL